MYLRCPGVALFLSPHFRLLRGGPLEELLAGAIWEVRPAVARRLLRDEELELLIGRVDDRPLYPDHGPASGLANAMSFMESGRGIWR